MPLSDYVPNEVLAGARALPGRFVRFGNVGVMAVVAQEGHRRGQANGVQIEDRQGRVSAVVEADGIRERIHLSDYGYNRSDVEELNRLLTKGRVRRVAGPAPHQVASGLFVPKG